MRKRMTAILGLQYLDGVLMVADTEESLGPGAKSECDKLYRFPFGIGTPPIGISNSATKTGTMLTGGAGDSHLIESANQELQRLFQRGIDPTTDMLDLLNNFVRNFISETMEPYRNLPPEAIVPQPIELLIAITVPPNWWLFCWKGSRVILIPSGTHASIGIGVVQIHPMLRDVQFSASQECMLFHGMRMMFAAKRAVEGVGGRTEAIALQNDGATHYFGTDILQKVEDFMVNYEQFKIKVLDGHVSTIACLDPRIEPELERNVEAAWADLAGILKQYRESYKKIFKQSGAQT